MNKTLRYLIVFSLLFLFIFLAFANYVSAQFASDWPLFQRNSNHTGFNNDEDSLTPPLDQVWNSLLDSPSSSIVSSGGVIYAKTGTGKLYAIDNSTGNINWQVQTQAGGAIAVANNTVYAGNSCDNCTLDAFNATSGQLIWSTVPLSRGVLGINVAGDKIFFGSHASNVRAADASTGAILWETGVSDGLVATPAVADGVIYIGSFCCTLYALNADTGSIIWSRPNLGGVFASSPTVVDGKLYIGSGTAQVFAVDASTGATIWTFGPTEDSVWGSPSVANDIVYIQTLAGRIYALNASTGTLIWTFKVVSDNGTNPMAVANGVIYQTSPNGNVYALNSETGAVLWQYTTGVPNFSPIVADNKLFFTSNDGKINAFENSSSDLQVLQLKQTSNPWQSDIYDTANIWSPSDPTINSWGCALTSAVMVFKYHGLNKLPDGTTLDPGSLNYWLKNQPDGYIHNGLVNWLALSRLSRLAKSINEISSFDALEYRRVNSYNSTQLTTDINNGIPGILEEPGHFIVAKGINGSTFNINDPYYSRLTLSDYGNTFLSLGRFLPSSTDLSYIMLIVDEDVNIKLFDSFNNQAGEQYIQDPIENDSSLGEYSGDNLKIIYLSKPDSGGYKIEVSSATSNDYNLDAYFYDTQGNIHLINLSGFVSSNNEDIYDINFDRENNQDSTINAAFNNLHFDLNYLLSTGGIKNKGLYNSLKSKSENAQKAKDNKTKTNILNALLNEINAQRGKGLTGFAYQIILNDITALRNN